MATRNPQKTRDRLLQTAFQEMHIHGYQGMRIDEILRLSGLKKGAFYHHFNSKKELGYAILEEQIKPLIEHIWIEPLTEIDNPIQELPQFLGSLGKHIPPLMREHGCPLNNLAQEMACLDEGFQQRIARLFSDWIDAFETVLKKGQQQGYIRKGVNCHQVARFLVAALEGCIGLFKVERSPEQWQACQLQIAAYLTSLQPDHIQ